MRALKIKVIIEIYSPDNGIMCGYMEKIHQREFMGEY
jgi:hypothetical protein